MGCGMWDVGCGMWDVDEERRKTSLFPIHLYFLSLPWNPRDEDVGMLSVNDREERMGGQLLSSYLPTFR